LHRAAYLLCGGDTHRAAAPTDATGGSSPAQFAVGLGIAGTTFAAGSAMVVRAYPPARRGMALSVFGAGMGIAITVLGCRCWRWPWPGMRYWPRSLPATARIGGHRARATGRSARTCWGYRRPDTCPPGTPSRSVGWSIGLYLPAYLRHVYHLGAGRAVLGTAACLTVAAASRPVGGWLCQRRGPVAVLRI
jgi:NNP family nitrate/nitrite transporter-like MFS transporter